MQLTASGHIASRHIAVVTSTFPLASETFVVDHVRGMIGKGWRVSVVANSIDLRAARAVLAGDFSQVSLVPLPGAIRSLARYSLHWIRGLRDHAQPGSSAARLMAVRAERVRHVLKSLSPDLVHAHFGPNGITSALALRGSTSPLIVNFHGYDATSWPSACGWDLYRHLLANATLITHSDFLSKRISSNLGRLPVKVTMGVNLRNFAPLRPRETDWSRPLRLLSVGRLEAIKGHDTALQVLALLRDRRPELDARLTIVGAGKERRSLESLARRLRVNAFVAGPSPAAYKDMPQIMNEADVLLACSRRGPDGWEESFCRAAAEAMACGLPVVATPCGGLPDTLGRAGSIASSHDATAVADALLQMLAAYSPDGHEIRALAQARSYDLDRMIDEYHAVSLRALTEGRR